MVFQGNHQVGFVAVGLVRGGINGLGETRINDGDIVTFGGELGRLRNRGAGDGLRLRDDADLDRVGGKRLT